MHKIHDGQLSKELAGSIGRAARGARTALELTQEDAAERIGVSAEFYARIERGNALPSVQTLARISSSLGVDADELLGRSEGTRPHVPRTTWSAAQPPTDPPELRRLVRRLRKASPATLRLVTMLAKELER